MNDRWTGDNVCRGCGHHASRHEEDPTTLRLKCPIVREEKYTPVQERVRSPRGDY